MTTEAKPKRKTRGHGEGSVFQRADGRWCAMIVVGCNSTGKRTRKAVYGKTKSEVTKKLTRLQNDKLDGTLMVREQLTLADLIDRWLSSWVDNIAPGTVRNYRLAADAYVTPNLGGMSVEKIQPVHVRALLDKMAKDGKGIQTRYQAFKTLRRALNLALKLELVSRNACDAVDVPRAPSKEVVPLTVEQAESLLQHVQGTRWEALFTLALSTGLRQGELFGLHWADVDLDRGVLSVTHSVECIGSSPRLKEPKSASSRRVVRLDASDLDCLREHRKRLADEGLAFGPLVFPAPEGGLVNKNNFHRRVWEPIREALGLESVRFHDLRHSNASFLLRAGTHPKIVQARLGHSTIKLTMDRYSHLLPDAQDDAAGAFHRTRQNAKAANGCQIAVNVTEAGSDDVAECA